MRNILTSMLLVLITLITLAPVDAAQSSRQRAQLSQQLSVARANAGKLYAQSHREEANAIGLHDGLMRDYSSRIQRRIAARGGARSQAKAEIRNRLNSVLALYRQSIMTRRNAQNAWRRVIPMIRAYFIPRVAAQQVRAVETTIRNIENEIRRVERVIKSVQRRWNPVLSR